MKYATLILRILTGVLFIFSGIIKANDPLGFGYKLEEYFVEFGMDWDWLLSIKTFLAAAICVFEVVLGVALILGYKMVLVTWLSLLMMVFFTILTGASAIFDIVRTCGCFGDAIPLTPWQSFYKDLILDAIILLLFIKRKEIKPFLPEKINATIILLSIFGTIYFTVYVTRYLPVWDFRPYKVGNNIPELMKLPPNAKPSVYENILYYKNKNTGKVEEFTEQNYPWDDEENYEFVDRKTKLIEKGDEPKIHDFNILTEDGFDITEDILNDPEPIFVVIMYDLNLTNVEGLKKVNTFAQDCYNKGYNIIALTATGFEKINELKKKYNLVFDFYNTDEVTLKTIVRSNPGVILLRQGTIEGKWSFRDLPDPEQIINNKK
jgi:uncharacterized membrane protein YphA (DoxX/SURF4 family)